MTPVERAVAAALPYLGIGLVVAASLLAVPSPSGSVVWFLVHLVVLVAFGLGTAAGLAGQAGGDWLVARPARRRYAASGVGVVTLTTGVVALVTMASAAALRYPPSTQYLQLLSALDIAWGAAAVVVGMRRLAGSGPAVVAGAVFGVVCVASIGLYLRAVGFASDGGWLVDGAALLRYVIPADVVAAIVAAAVLTAGTLAAAARERVEP